MNAHDQLERQLRASIAQRENRQAAHRSRRRVCSRGRSALIVTATTAVALAVAVSTLVMLHHRRPPSSHPAAPATSTRRSQIGQRPKNPGPIPPNVQNGAVAAALTTVWAEYVSCQPGAGGGPGAGLSYGSPSAAMLSTLPILRRPATSADRVPANLYVHFDGRLRLLLGEQGGDVYVRYVRRVRVAEGRTFYLIPISKHGRPPLAPAAANRCYRLEVAALQAGLPSVPRAKRAPTRRYGDAQFALDRYTLETSSVRESVDLISETSNDGGVGGDVQSLESVEQGGQLSGDGGGKPPIPIVMAGIAPSGVAAVTLLFPATRHGSRRLPAVNATGDVVNNVFVIQVPTLFERGGWPTTAIWRSSSGKLIKIVNEVPFHP